MKLKLLEIRGVGTDNERVWIQATEDIDLGDYIVTGTFRENGKKSDKRPHVFESNHKR
jgi:hypothetical protein